MFEFDQPAARKTLKRKNIKRCEKTKIMRNPWWLKPLDSCRARMNSHPMEATTPTSNPLDAVAVPVDIGSASS